MLKKLNTFLNCIIGSFIGVFIARSIYTYWDYKVHPEIYAVSSAPWYISIQIFGLIVAVVVVISFIMKLIIRRKMK